MLGPIFTREWLILPRNGRLQAQRAAWMGLFWVIALTTWLSTAEWSRPGQYLELARLGPLIFQVFAVVQVVLLVFYAALSAASAVALERSLSMALWRLSRTAAILGRATLLMSR